MELKIRRAIARQTRLVLNHTNLACRVDYDLLPFRGEVVVANGVTNNASYKKPKSLPRREVAWAPFSAAKVCTRLCWPTGGESGPRESSRL